MKNSNLIIIVVLLLLVFFGCSRYNNMVTQGEGVAGSWAKVESQYQRRADLIPNLVKTVQGVANFEKSTITAVIEARASASKITVDPKNLTPEALEKFEASQGQLSQALGKLMVVSEQYPQLKATQNFSDLQAELAGTENRITVARNDFNGVVQGYNVAIKRFPSNIFAKIFGFGEKGYFKSATGSDKAPEVKF